MARFSDEDLWCMYHPPERVKVVSYHPLIAAQTIFDAWKTLHLAEHMRSAYVVGAERRKIPRVWEPGKIHPALVEWHRELLRRGADVWHPEQILQEPA